MVDLLIDRIFVQLLFSFFIKVNFNKIFETAQKQQTKPPPPPPINLNTF